MLVCTISHELVGRFQPDLHGDHDLFFKVSAGLKLPNLSQKVLVCLMNQLADFNQICMDIIFGHDKKLNRFW